MKKPPLTSAVGVVSLALVGVLAFALANGHSRQPLPSRAAALPAVSVPSAPPAPAGYLPFAPLPAGSGYPQASFDPSSGQFLPVSSGTPPCKASQLEGVHVFGGAGLGNLNVPVELRNRSNFPCALEGFPDLSVLDATGRVLAEATGPANRGTYFDDESVAVPVLMTVGTPALPREVTGASGPLHTYFDAPRGQAYLNIQWIDCRSLAGTQLAVSLPSGGGAVRVPFPVSTYPDPTCPGSGVRLLRGPLIPTGFTWPPSPSTTVVSLTVAAPGAVKRGSTLVYYVTLTNRSQTPYSLDFCPNFEESLGLSRVGILTTKLNSFTFQLNCGLVKQISAGSTVSFQMELSVSSATETGQTTLSWYLDDARVSVAEPVTTLIQVTG